MIARSKTARFLGYTLLPQIRPRLERIFAQGFGPVPYLIARVYGAVRLLPPGHPYLQSRNIGRFGVRHVIGEAANNLVFSRKNLDQIVLFFTILLGLGLGLVQLILLGAFFLFGSAMAQGMPGSFSGFFVTNPAYAANDLAYIMLDLVFGVPGVFNSCVSTQTDCLLNIDGVTGGGTGDGLADPWTAAPLGYPFPIHDAIHQLFQFYSTGLMVVGALLLAYYVVAVVAETAQTGTPFGKRFNKVWAPLRLVTAFGLLIPISYGMNAGQYIVLYAAKYGSGFASNAWIYFNQKLIAAYGNDFKNMLAEGGDGTASNLVSTPNVPEVGTLLQFMYVARTCAESYMFHDPQVQIKPYLVKDPLAQVPALEYYVPYEDMIEFADGSNKIILRFGVQDQERFPSHKGFVAPLCGEITIPLTDPRDPQASNANARPDKGTEMMQRYYYWVIGELWYAVFQGNPPSGYAISSFSSNYPLHQTMVVTQVDSSYERADLNPPPEYRAALQDFYRQDINAMLHDPSSTGLTSIPGVDSQGVVRAQVASGRWSVSPTLQQKGWAAAGVWYNKVAELNGTVTTATLNVPMPTRYPEVMEYVLASKIQQDQYVPPERRYEPVLADQKEIKFEKPFDRKMAIALWRSFDYWQQGGLTSTTHTAVTHNAFIDAVNSVFGTEGLYNMRKNPNVHPLAKIVGVGRSLIESSIRNLGFAAAGGVAGRLMGDTLGNTIKIGAGFLISVAMITLGAGFVLYYVVPFMPFIYFFFAFSGWIKAIFEAMVGAPLWALGHIRIDGEGFTGGQGMALGGYVLIFEIFLRPLLIVIGLVASITIFAGMVAALDDVWDLVRANMAGFDSNAAAQADGESQLRFMRTAIDEFFYTVVYTVIVYMMGMSSFKMIDAIPENIMRWAGLSVSPFNAKGSDPAQELSETSYQGASIIIPQIGGGLRAITK